MENGVAGPAGWSDEVAARWAALVEEIRRRLGAGASPERWVRQALEPRLGQDLAGTMVHRGPFPGRLARALRADALAVGSHILGDAHRLDPATARGAALLGHELVHVADATHTAGGMAAPAPSPAGPGSATPLVQRSDGEGEATAQAVERDLLTRPRPRDTRRRPVAAEVLAERVYERLLDAVRLERERTPWRW